MRKPIICVLTLISFLFSTLIFAEENNGRCIKLDAKVTGPEAKYSMFVEVNNEVIAYAEIGCSIEWRNRVLCALEQLSFNYTAKVYDFYSGAELEMTKAFYVVEPSAPSKTRVIAFAEQKKADAYVAESGSGAVVDYTALIEIPF